MSGVLRAAITRHSRIIKNSVRGYAEGGLMETTGRPPKLYVGVQKAPKIPTWVSNRNFNSKLTSKKKKKVSYHRLY